MSLLHHPSTQQVLKEVASLSLQKSAAPWSLHSDGPHVLVKNREKKKKKRMGEAAHESPAIEGFFFFYTVIEL